ncbi:unnamed protein product [Orchesella dallaii]|uniref:Odorant receptor n=1 Tax=Orchesella dallaii TaxID=48710 RepID=A0ABP1QV28_9HEXA
MFSKRLFKILGFRNYIMQIGYTSPFRWDFATHRLISAPWYVFWNFKMYTFYVCMFGILLGTRLAQKTILNKNVIFGEDETEVKKHRLEPVIIALDIGVIALLICITSLFALIALFKDEIIKFFNEMLDFDAFLDEIFRNNLKGRNKLDNNTAAEIDLLMLLVAVSTLFIPVMFGLYFLQDTEPLNRFFLEVLEVEIKPELKFLPLVLFVMWSVLQCCNVAGLFLSIGIMYIKFVPFWLTALNPSKILRCGCGSRFQMKYVTNLGLLGEQSMIKLHRTHQVLNRIFNHFMANPLLSNHQAGLQVLVIVTCFLTIEYFEEMLYTPGYQLVFVTIFLCFFIVYVEAKIVSDANITADEFRRKIRSLTRRKNEVFKSMGGTWSLRIHIAYPYYTVSRTTFLEFVQRTVEFLVDLLMAN